MVQPLIIHIITTQKTNEEVVRYSPSVGAGGLASSTNSLGSVLSVFLGTRTPEIIDESNALSVYVIIRKFNPRRKSAFQQLLTYSAIKYKSKIEIIIFTKPD